MKTTPDTPCMGEEPIRDDACDWFIPSETPAPLTPAESPPKEQQSPHEDPSQGTALSSQVGGSHYSSLPYQPIELICRLDLSFIQGNIIKYISRFRRKGLSHDLDKAFHYCHLAADLNHIRHPRVAPAVLGREITTYCDANGFDILIRYIIAMTASNRYIAAAKAIAELQNATYTNHPTTSP